jgi:hypothetical protein
VVDPGARLGDDVTRARAVLRLDVDHRRKIPEAERSDLGEEEVRLTNSVLRGAEVLVDAANEPLSP